MLALFAVAVLADSAAPESSRPIVQLSPVVVTATRHPTSWRRSLGTTFWVPGGIPAGSLPRGSTEAVGQIPGVMAQKTSPGQGSPFVRGFTGFRNVHLIDGIRLNHSAFREGPNQYWSTIDALAMERFEVFLGPASVLYGSDAVGGVLQALSRDPDRPDPDRPRLGVRYRGATGERSNAGRIWSRLPLGGSVSASGGLTSRRFGSLEAGHDLGRQPYTGYDEACGDVRLDWRSPAGTVTLFHQGIRQRNVPRTHATIHAESFAGTTVGSDLRRELDQERRLTYLQLASPRMAAADDGFRASLSWQEHEEDEDRVRGSGARQIQGFDVGTLGAHAQLVRRGLVAGAEYYRDQVDSYSTASAIQGPVADDASYDLAAAYLQHERTWRDAWVLQAGLRYSHAAARADRFEDPATGNPRALRSAWNATVGSARLGYRPASDRWLAFASASQGFRAPNLSDLTRLDAARTSEVEIPAPGLDPERFVSAELGARLLDPRFFASASLFRTWTRGQIVRLPTGRTAGTDVEVTRANSGDGWVHGAELAAAAWLIRDVSLGLEGAWQRGELDQFPTAATTAVREPMSRLLPTTLRARLEWLPRSRPFELRGELVVAGRQDRLSSEDRRDTSRIPPGGTPGYEVLNLRAAFRAGGHLRVVTGVENVTDRDYRIHGSGTNEPGRSLVLGIDASF